MTNYEAEMLDMIYQEGIDAYKEGAIRSENYYVDGSSANQAWDNGWIYAATESANENPQDS